MDKLRLNLGHDTHAYSPLLREYIKTLKINNTVKHEIVIEKLDKLIEKYGPSIVPGVNNIKARINKTNNTITDPELPEFNNLPLLNKILDSGSDLIKETLVEIGSTCMQGVTHRLLMLYHVL
jgi:hypothetical protein